MKLKRIKLKYGNAIFKKKRKLMESHFNLILFKYQCTSSKWKYHVINLIIFQVLDTMCSIFLWALDHLNSRRDHWLSGNPFSRGLSVDPTSHPTFEPSTLACLSFYWSMIFHNALSSPKIIIRRLCASSVEKLISLT